MLRQTFSGAALALVALTACGRFRFDAVPGDGGSGDASPDAPQPDVTCATAVSPARFDELGSGTRGDPYVLCNADQLTDMMNNGTVTASYAVGAAIDMTGRTVHVFAAPMAPFSGDFDGGNHEISGLSIITPADDFVAMFSTASGTLHDVVLTGVSIHGNKYVAGLVAWLKEEASVVRCSTSGTVTADDTYAGGLIGFAGLEWIDANIGAMIAASSSSASITALDFAGGLAGSATGESSIYDSFATGSVNGAEYVGGLVGGTTGVISSSYATGTVTANNTCGGLIGSSGGVVIDSFATGDVVATLGTPTHVGKLLGEQFGDEVINSFSALTASCTAPGGCHASLPGELVAVTAAQLGQQGTSPSNQWSTAAWVFGAGVPTLAARRPDSTWTSCADHMTDAPYAGGDGTLAFPFHICTATQLGALASRTQDWSHFYAFELHANVDLATAQPSRPIGNDATPFIGVFDGRGHTVSNLVINTPAVSYCGLFGMFAGRLSRLGVVNVDVTCQAQVGAIVGSVNRAYVHDVFATGSVSNNGYEVGGAVGILESGWIYRGYFRGQVDGLDVGGFVGRDVAFGGAGEGVHDSFASAAITTGDDAGHFATTTVSSSNYYDPSTTCPGCDVADLATPAASQAALYDPSNPPLLTWDFTTVWQANVGAPPTLRLP